jgi:EAL domain-containing protein (putative c-di-GMP-specific phosphodiesterase class I)/ActR/RegA family two-component response regulator
METKQSILVIDDDQDLGELILAIAQQAGHTCVVTSDVEAFFDKLTPEITLVMIDLIMPGMDGIEILRMLAQKQHAAHVVLMSGLGKRVIKTAEQFGKASGLSVIGHLQKPFKIQDILDIFAICQRHGPLSVPKAITELVIEDEELRAAIQRNEFVNFYQPQIDLATGEVVGVEALVRWRHPKHGLVFPDSFISRMEQLRLIDDLGWLVIQRALSEVGMFADQAGTIPAISVNVSVLSLQDLTFPDRLAVIVKAWNVPPDQVTIEITESGLVQELATTLDVFARLRMKHFELSIDDFGTGYSMMQQLQMVPACELKIDRSFVQNMGRSESDRVMVLKTIEIGHELNMSVIAEGVETSEQLEFLKAVGCDLVQGYLFSRPLSAPDLVTWLTTYAATIAQPC